MLEQRGAALVVICGGIQLFAIGLPAVVVAFVGQVAIADLSL